ncbi:archease [Thiohalomonas denitrificans]|uniref:SHS2 domain-containing protein n=1 Tax=Thiohalomonas denitrificans TaxID=415747 RepID=A0A1G5PSV3_9GAMM|nr:archease [Thiohalomonas denitrificans]SCZ52468.1 SHS2 domain-containing protein [Thiohalomonas denitrificans]
MKAADSAGYELFPHEADMGVRGWGDRPDTAFEQTGLAMTAVVTDPVSVRPETQVTIRCEAPDLELLLVDWLNALIYEMATRHLLFSRFDVRIEGPRLSGSAWGEPVNRERHGPAVEIKGATYTALRVYREAERWVAQTVVDI